MDIPSWLKLAKLEIGTLETPGPKDNPKILKYAEDARVAGVVNHDSVPWCAAFVGAMLERAHSHSSGKANAKSYVDWGVKLRTPVLGCVVVLNRPPSEWQGHVGFYIGRPMLGKIRLLGGNQGDMVSEADFDSDRVNCYRWPADALISADWVGPIGVATMATSNPSDR